MNKQYLSGFTAILIAILIIAPGIAGADSKNRCTVPNVYKNVTACDAHKILEQRDVFLLDVRTPVLHQLDQKIIYPHYDFKHLTEKYFEIGMKLDDFLIQLVKYCTPTEYNYSHIAGAKLIPLKNVPVHDPVNLSDDKLLPNRMKELPKNKNTKIVVYCYTGKRGGIASQMLADAGYKRVYSIQDGLQDNIQDGLPAWVNAGYPVVIDSVKWAANYPHYF